MSAGTALQRERIAALALLVCGGLGWAFLQQRVAASDAALAARREQLEQLRVLAAVPRGAEDSLTAVVALLDGRRLQWSERDGIGYLAMAGRP